MFQGLRRALKGDRDLTFAPQRGADAPILDNVARAAEVAQHVHKKAQVVIVDPLSIFKSTPKEPGAQDMTPQFDAAEDAADGDAAAWWSGEGGRAFVPGAKDFIDSGKARRLSTVSDAFEDVVVGNGGFRFETADLAKPVRHDEREPALDVDISNRLAAQDEGDDDDADLFDYSDRRKKKGKKVAKEEQNEAPQPVIADDDDATYNRPAEDDNGKKKKKTKKKKANAGDSDEDQEEPLLATREAAADISKPPPAPEKEREPAPQELPVASGKKKVRKKKDPDKSPPGADAEKKTTKKETGEKKERKKKDAKSTSAGARRMPAPPDED